MNFNLSATSKWNFNIFLLLFRLERHPTCMGVPLVWYSYTFVYCKIPMVFDSNWNGYERKLRILVHASGIPAGTSTFGPSPTLNSLVLIPFAGPFHPFIYSTFNYYPCFCYNINSFRSTPHFCFTWLYMQCCSIIHRMVCFHFRSTKHTKKKTRIIPTKNRTNSNQIPNKN